MLYRRSYRSPLGELTMFSDGAALTALSFQGQRYSDTNAASGAVELSVPPETGKEKESGADAVFRRTGEWLDIYFSGQNPGFTPPLFTRGTPFQEEVWEILKEIPYGQTISYGEIAGRIAGKRGIKRMAAQAVGGAVGRNPIVIIVPCHRVVGSDGSLTGYGGGLDRKVELLKLENFDFAG